MPGIDAERQPTTCLVEHPIDLMRKLNEGPGMWMERRDETDVARVNHHGRKRA